MFTTSRTDSPAVHMTTRNYFQNTVDATMALDKSLNVQPDSDVHVQSHPQGCRVHVETTALTQLSHIPMWRVCIFSAHTYQFRQLNTIFKSIDFSSRRIWIMTTYQLRGFGNWLIDMTENNVHIGFCPPNHIISLHS